MGTGSCRRQGRHRGREDQRRHAARLLFASSSLLAVILCVGADYSQKFKRYYYCNDAIGYNSWDMPPKVCWEGHMPSMQSTHGRSHFLTLLPMCNPHFPHFCRVCCLQMQLAEWLVDVSLYGVPVTLARDAYVALRRFLVSMASIVFASLTQVTCTSSRQDHRASPIQVAVALQRLLARIFGNSCTAPLPLLAPTPTQKCPSPESFADGTALNYPHPPAACLLPRLPLFLIY